MRRAAKIDRNQTEIVSALRKIGCKVQSLAALGSGVPDLLVLVPLRPPTVFGPTGPWLLLLEVKDPQQPPNKRRLKPAQVEWHAEWAGAPLAVVESVEDALKALA